MTWRYQRLIAKFEVKAPKSIVVHMHGTGDKSFREVVDVYQKGEEDDHQALRYSQWLAQTVRREYLHSPWSFGWRGHCVELLEWDQNYQNAEAYRSTECEGPSKADEDVI